MEDSDWVLVRRPLDGDFWEPGLAETETSDDLKLRFTGPAQHWTDAIPIGNGRVGAMVWGGVASETLNLNEDTLWTGIPGDYTKPDAPKALSEVRNLVNAGQYVEATKESVNLLSGLPEVYQLLGDIKIEFDASHAAYKEETYMRELDLDTATARVKYSVGEVEYVREHFASNPDQVVVTKVSGSKSGSISFTVSLDSKLQYQSRVNGNNQIIMEGSCPGKRLPKRNENDNPKGIQFYAVLDLQISNGVGGIQNLGDGKLKVKGSDWAVMLLVTSSSFAGPFTKPSDSKRDPASECQSTLNSIRNLSYADLWARHLDDYQYLFHRVSLQLSKSSKSVGNKETLGMKKVLSRATDPPLEGSNNETISTAERVKSFQTDEDPSLVELLFQYGRYLLISCSRPGTQVANLQGIWNKDIEPKWDCAPHLNINLQMNYWPSLPCNLHECQQPLFDYISLLSVNGRKTAQVNYEASGWVVHHTSDMWARTSPQEGEPVWAVWPMGGAWVCTHLWEHYAYTKDKGFLENMAYPLLEGCSSFLLDWLIEGQGGYLETNPSTSPEHSFIAPDGKLAGVSYSSTMDMAIIREIFSAVVSAAEVLDKSEDDLIRRVRKAQLRLYPTKIAVDGSIMEWAQDFEDPEVHHRHLSHLFGLFPGHTITPEDTADLCKAATYTLYKRGWSTTWKAALWARLHNSEHAYRMVKHLFNLVDPDHEVSFRGGLYSNLFAAHPPFQIDANFGFCAAVAEMLVQSTLEDLYLLPALPGDKWANGCVEGLKARGNLTVNICWKEGDLHEVSIWSKSSNSIKRLHYGGITVSTDISSGTAYTFNKQLNCVKTYSPLF
ncbi:alpha-L-fucosidase 2-like isoform X2 [Diospyros lotus]|uniref:alpha-L-fucosidase 2-like isoform X2 n=1 Tax=Diospyros lotus TaxID=55363 RepID=UPI0022530F3C|nr:alpha-L-fucosidase 2-like isoform X2 [Diospyros lotus]